MPPTRDEPHDAVRRWVTRRLSEYSAAHPEVIDRATPNAQVPLPDAKSGDPTLKPDLAAYCDTSPVLVVEVLFTDDAVDEKNRNAELYLRVPSVREFWLLDIRDDPEQPTLTVYRRRGKRWQKPIIVDPGVTYRTKLLPGLELVIDPKS